MSPFRSLPLIALLAAVGPLPDVVAQRDAGDATERESARRVLEQELPDDEREALAEREELRRLGRLAEPAARPAPSLTDHARTLVAFRPRRIAPGQTGEVHLVLVFHRQAGVEAGARFAVTAETEQGPLRVGSAQVGDPQPGAIHPSFVGRPVWEDTATFTAPITVTPGTPHDRYPVELRVEADLTDGVSGQPLGRHSAVVKALLDVGDPIPTPPAPSRASAALRETVLPPAAPPAAAPIEPEGARDAVDPAEEVPAAAPIAADDAVRAAQEDVGPADAPASASSRWMLLTAGGVLIVVVALLVFARGRRERGA